MIYESFAKFDKSAVSCIKDQHLNWYRLGLLPLALASIVFVYFGNNTTAIYIRLICDLDLQATLFALLAVILSLNASKVDSDIKIQFVGSLLRKKRALIANEIAISMNIAVSLIYFVFIPIVYGASEFKINI